MNTHNISKVSQKKHRALREECRRVGRLPEFKEPSCLDHPAMINAQNNLHIAKKNVEIAVAFSNLNMFYFLFDVKRKVKTLLFCRQDCEILDDIFDSEYTVHDPEGNMCKGVKRDKKKWNKRPEHPKHTPLVGKKLKKYKSNHQKTKLLEDIDLDDELVL